jgi:hypothetical protein
MVASFRAFRAAGRFSVRRMVEGEGRDVRTGGAGGGVSGLLAWLRAEEALAIGASRKAWNRPPSNAPARREERDVAEEAARKG